MDRKLFSEIGITTGSKILEIGPSYNPMYRKRDGYNVDIVDHLPKEELIKKMASLDISAIEDVDFVCSGSYADAIPHRKYYDLIIGSHIIEHMLDFIGFFEDCDKLLSDTGVVKLIVPDSRYEFDYFRENSSLKSIIDTHTWRNERTRTAHTMGTFAEHQMNCVQFQDLGTYFPDSAILSKEKISFSSEIPARLVSRGVNILSGYDENHYIDLHNWMFTPKSFEILIYELNYLGYINFVVDLIAKELDSIEFYVILKRGKIESINRSFMLNMMIEHKLEALECMKNYIQKQTMTSERKFITNFYMNTGWGYSEDEKLSLPITKNSDNSFVIKVFLPQQCKKMRWDPIEGERIRLTDLDIQINGYRTCCSNCNGKMQDSGKDITFDTLDPQLEYTLPALDDTVYINIHGRIYFLS